MNQIQKPAIPSDDYLAALDDEAKQEMAWRRWPGVRAEFLTFKDFQGYCNGLSQGRIRLTGRGVTRLAV